MSAAESSGENSWPKTVGWYDFLNTDRPETDNHVDMAKAAFCFLAIDAGGQWRRLKIAFQAIMGFLIEYTAAEPTARGLQKNPGNH